jgi:hypothetical protein
MSTPEMPAAEHPRFDAICAPVDDFEPLPTVKVESLPEEETDEREEALDGLILAALVAPY